MIKVNTKSLLADSLKITKTKKTPKDAYFGMQIESKKNIIKDGIVSLFSNQKNKYEQMISG